MLCPLKNFQQKLYFFLTIICASCTTAISRATRNSIIITKTFTATINTKALDTIRIGNLGLHYLYAHWCLLAKFFDNKLGRGVRIFLKSTIRGMATHWTVAKCGSTIFTYNTRNVIYIYRHNSIRRCRYWPAAVYTQNLFHYISPSHQKQKASS